MPARSPARPRLGIIVNPLAGLGGPVALKGSDGADTVALAQARGAVPQAPQRAARTLRALAETVGAERVLAAPGPMGAALAREAGLEVTATAAAPERPTTAADTRDAAVAMAEAGVELLMFAGGDGTARDIHDVVGAQLPVIGIPAGVKMHSGVFAATPEAAARAGAAFLRGSGRVALRRADIADVDEQAVREGRVASVLYGSATVPDLQAVLPAKAGSRATASGELDALCRTVAAEMERGTLALIGPGTTTAAVLAGLGLEGTLLGVDAVLDGRLVGRDLREEELLALLGAVDDAVLITGLIGGQGVLFGRGNRQLGSQVLRRVGRDRIMILSSADKLLALDPPTLWVDTGDPELDAELCGYVRVHVGPNRQIVMRISS
jgi:predicted polyphosphate/ATP-dependent NAD kinase